MSKSDIRQLADRLDAHEALYREWRSAAERAEVASQMRSAVVQAESHMDAMRAVREVCEALDNVRTAAYERYTAAAGGEKP